MITDCKITDFFLPSHPLFQDIIRIFAAVKRYFGIISLLLVLAVWVGLGNRSRQSGAENEAVVSLLSTRDNAARDRLFDAAPVPQRHEATLSGRADTFHACNERGRRLLPTAGFSPRNTAAHIAANNTLAVEYRAKVWQSRLSALPQICLSVRYYVIALRHILR